MSVRKGLLGLGAALTMTGTLAAVEPPANPLVEGREPNPVAREFYESEPTPRYGNGPAPTSYQKPAGLGWWGMKVGMGTVFERLMQPLATTTLWD